MPFVLLVVSTYLRLPLLEDLDFESTFSRPLFSQIFVKLFNRLVLKFLAFTRCLEGVVLFFGLEPSEVLLHSLLQNLGYLLRRYQEASMQSLGSIWVLRHRFICFLHVIVHQEFRLLYLDFLIFNQFFCLSLCDDRFTFLSWLRIRWLFCL